MTGVHLQIITHQALLWGHPGSPHIELRPLSRKIDVIVMDLAILDVHMGEPHIRGAAAGAISLEVQGVNPGFPAVYPQVIKAAHRIAPVDLHVLRTGPVSGRIDEHKFPGGEPPVSDLMLMSKVWAAAAPGKMTGAAMMKSPIASQADILVTRFMAISSGSMV